MISSASGAGIPFSYDPSNSHYGVRDAVSSYFSDDEEARVGEELEGESTSVPRSNMSEAVDLGETAPGGSQITQKQQICNEGTPLLNAPSTSTQYGYRGLDTCISRESHVSADRSLIQRKSSTTLKESYNYGGQSTYKQTLFNSIAILLGVGMLSEPLAFAYAGWIGGTVSLIFLGILNCYTAKILARITLEDYRLRSYADIGRKAFGLKSTVLTTTLFCFELFAFSVIFVTLAADSLHEIIPEYSADSFKVWFIVILAPLVFTPLSMLSYSSMLGICSTLLIILVIFIDGFSKPDAPGSLWSPVATSWGTGSMTELGIALGLLMAGFSGHAVMPSLARDMVDPSQFDDMINWAFIIATFIYAVTGYAGYLMFGQNVSDEISKDLMNTPGYNQWINEITLWLFVLGPLTKFPLSARPINVIFEVMLNIDNHPPTHGSIKSQQDTQTSTNRRRLLNRMIFIVERVSIPVLAIMVSILVPEFSSLMAFGSSLAFVICIIGPISAKVALDGRCGFIDASLLAVTTLMAIWGMVAAFLTA